MPEKLQTLLDEIRGCQLCVNDMKRPPRPVVQAAETARILIVGQAPGNLVFESGRPFTDPSGDRLRAWLGIDETAFYDPRQVAIVPMGFCFPGYDDKGGDLPPMRRCAETWRERLLKHLTKIQLTVVIGSYAQRWHLGDRREKTLTATVAKWRDFLSDGLIVTPHPSWRNTGWLKRNPWFETDVLPVLRTHVQAALS